jgi:hypothetical protein
MLRSKPLTMHGLMRQPLLVSWGRVARNFRKRLVARDGLDLLGAAPGIREALCGRLAQPVRGEPAKPRFIAASAKPVDASTLGRSSALE